MMLSYLVVTLNSGGGLVCLAETNEVMNLHLGEFETLDFAIESASELLNCHHVKNGVIIKGNHTAWSLAGASLYLSIYDDKVKEILAT